MSAKPMQTGKRALPARRAVSCVEAPANGGLQQAAVATNAPLKSDAECPLGRKLMPGLLSICRWQTYATQGNHGVQTS